VIPIYTLRYYNQRLAGNVFRCERRCGKSNCRCSKDRKYWHPFYVLEYRERVDGQWKRKREYVPKAKVKALRQRIKRAKQRDKEMQENTRAFLENMPRLVERIKRNPFDIAAIHDAKKLIKTLDSITHLTVLQIWTIFANVVDLVVVLYPFNSGRSSE